MKQYFQLQFQLTNRRFKDAGITPALDWIAVFSAFPAGSMYLFQKTEFAQYIYLLFSLSVTIKLSEIKRNDFLKTAFKTSEYTAIRLLENLFVSAPFILFLLYKNLFIIALTLSFLTVLLSLNNFRTAINVTIPTPFYKKPFEFTVGFRKTFYLFPGAYLLALTSIYTDNFNLGIFALILVFLVCLSYYLKPENEFYVWSYTLNARKFLWDKIKTALMHSLPLIAPVVLILGVGFFHHIWPLLLFVLIGYAFLLCIIAAKYSAYPDEMSLPQGILIAISLYFPPLLLLVIPYFFGQAMRKLKIFLR